MIEQNRANGPAIRGLDNALTHKEESAHLFKRTVDQVVNLQRKHKTIFPPAYFPNTSHIAGTVPFQTERRSEFHGPLKPAETVSLIILFREIEELSQLFGRSSERTARLKYILKISDTEWPHDVIEGMGKFGYQLGLASGVRERIVQGLGQPYGESLLSVTKLKWWNQYETPIRKDTMMLGKETADVMVRMVDEASEEDITAYPETARGPDQIKDRAQSRFKGAILARNLYLESLSLAAHFFPDK